jgi:uncharacterized protein (TIGR03067 family)
LKWTIKGNEFKLENASNKLQFAAVKFKLDATAEPKNIDITTADGKQGMGIYKLEGDTLTICRGEREEQRPKEFKIEAGVQTLTVLKRPTK